MKPQIIKTQIENEEALERMYELMESSPDVDSDEGRELELLSMLIEHFEEREYPVDFPDPISAIRFRMEQQGLKQADLAPYMGGRTKVSEVLSGKRSLSKMMIRNLHAELGIAAEVLLQEPEAKLGKIIYMPKDFPITEMTKRGYFGEIEGGWKEAKEKGEELLESLFSVLENNEQKIAFCKHSGTPNFNHLKAWQARSLHLVNTKKLPVYRSDQIGPELASTLAKLSYGQQGPLMAREYLNKKGIHLVFLPHLDQTYLDGACFLSSTGNPVIGLTLRHDRLDNFWFTLLHELGHIHLHLHDKHQAFYDDIESGGTVTEPIEIEANAFAADSFIPRLLWEERANDLLSATTTRVEVIEFSEQLNVHPSIIAGRICWELKDFTKHSPLRKKANLRKMFQDV